ncbi:MAG: sulfite exporter TauE/SafE family protein [Fusobacteriaceae bacterium]
MEISTFIFLGVACFLASFIDAIAGGGGLISLPAYMAVGIPPHIALGTNKMAASFSSISSSLRFYRSGKIDLEIVKAFSLFSFVGALIGVKAVLLIDQKYLYPIAMILLIGTIMYTVINKNMGETSFYKGLNDKNKKLGRIMSLFLGFYDGFFGPGTGSFLIFSLIKIFKLDFINASGNSKILNLSSNIASVIAFVIAGKVNYTYAFSMAIFMFLGAQAGAKMAIFRGSKFIKPFFLVVSTVVAIKMVTTFVNIYFT